MTFLNNIIDYLPTATLPDQMSSSLIYIMGFYKGFSEVFPFMTTVLTIFGIMLSIEIILFIYKAITYVLNLVRGSGN